MGASDPGVSQDEADAIARRGRTLAWAGLVPFAALSLWLTGIAADHPWREETIDLLRAYAGVILSFLGGIRWGLAMLRRSGTAGRDITLSVLPALAGWAAFFVPAPHVFALLAVAFAAIGAWDNFAVHDRLAPAWFGRMRIVATGLVVAALVLAFVATA